MRFHSTAVPAVAPAHSDQDVEHRSAGSRFAIPLSLLSLYFIWGSTYLAIRDAVDTIPPFYMGGIRFLIAGGILYGVLRIRGAANPTLRQWGGAAVVGLLLLAFGNGMVGLAEQSVASGLAAVIIGSVPLWAAAFAGVWGQWPRRIEVIGLVAGFGGVALLNAGSGLSGHPLAAAILVFAAMSWAFGSVSSRHLPLPSGLMASAVEMLIGGVAMMLLGAITREQLVMPSAGSAWAVVYLVLFGSFVAFSAYTYLLQHVRPALATSYAYVNPVVAVALGILLAGEHATLIEIMSLGLVLAAVAMVIVGRERRT